MNGNGHKAYVIDTSVAVKWYLPEEFSHEALRYMDDGITHYAPDYLTLEVSSVLLKRCRRRPEAPGRLPVAESRELIAAIQAFPFRYYPVGPLNDLAYGLALEVGSSFYDGLFLAVALQVSAKLVTADRKFYDKLAASEYASQAVWVGLEP